MSTAETVAAESDHERATRKTLGHLVMLCCAILCMLGLLYYTMKTTPPTPDTHPRATPTFNSKPPALPPPLSA